MLSPPFLLGQVVVGTAVLFLSIRLARFAEAFGRGTGFDSTPKSMPFLMALFGSSTDSGFLSIVQGAYDGGGVGFPSKRFALGASIWRECFHGDS